MEPIELVVWQELEGGVKAVVLVVSVGFAEMLSSGVGAKEVAVNDAASSRVCICDDEDSGVRIQLRRILGRPARTLVLHLSRTCQYFEDEVGAAENR